MTKELAFDKLVKRQTWFMGIIVTVILGLGGVCVAAMGSFRDVDINHEGRICTQEAITKEFLDNSGVEFIIRSVMKPEAERINIELDKKAEKDVVDIFIEAQKRTELKIDKLIEKQK